MEIDLTEIVAAVIALIGSIVTAIVIPLIRSKISAEDRETLYTLAKIGVQAAEQLCKTGVIKKEERKQYVLDFLKEKGYTVDLDEIDNLIESLVYELPKKLVAPETNKT